MRCRASSVSLGVDSLSIPFRHPSFLKNRSPFSPDLLDGLLKTRILLSRG